jgi:hypothetical protein
MPLDAGQYRTLILAEVKDPDNVGIAALVGDASAPGDLWTRHDDKPTLDLQYLYTKRDAILALAGFSWDAVDFEEAMVLRENLSQRSKNLGDLYEKTLAEILRQEKIAQASQGGAIGVIATVAPTAAPTGYFDANDPRYAGSPYKPLYPLR